MAKVTFEFDSEKDEFALQSAMFATQLRRALWDADQLLRTRMKHGDIGEDEYNFLDRVRDEISIIHVINEI